LPTPVQAPVHDCDHEYGCICRGATIVQALDVAGHNALPIEMLPVDALHADISQTVDLALTSAWTSAIDHDFSVPPISGRQLRARLASLVI
jgi:hypothetical protein